MDNVDKVVKLYKSLSLIPSLVGAKLRNKGSTVHTFWSQRNIEKGQTVKFIKTLGISSDLNKIYESMPIDITTESLSAISPSEKLKAVLRTGNENKQYLEIWQNQNLSKTVDLGALDLHGDVYTDGEFQAFQWSPDETKLLYIAEKKVPKSDPFYKRTGKKSKSNGEEDKAKSHGQEHLFVQDWGEQLVGKKKSVIAEYNLEKDDVEVLTGVPDGVCPAHVVYAPDGGYLVGVAYKTEPRKLGLIYCTNRASTIFKLDFNGNYLEFPLEDQSVKSPVFTSDGKTLLWLQREAGGPHHTALSLVKTNLPLTDKPVISVVTDAVKREVDTSNGTKFYGLYNTGFVTRCFASGNRLLLSTNQRNTINSYIIDIDSGKITELVYQDGSQVILDVVDDIVLVNRRNYLKPDKLTICKLPPKDQEVPLVWTDLTETSVIPGLENCTFDYLHLTHDNNDTIKDFSTIYVGPKSGPSKSVTLIVYPHGGPHSAYANYLFLEAALLMSLNFGVIFINYRGSIGAGKDSVDFLLGKIGESDVADCILATDSTLRKYPFLNPESVVLFGGSHGGFLVTHLSGQYPEKFKACVARNPVIDVASMSCSSDIPDWCYVEAGSEYSQVGKPDEEILLAMRRASPIEHAHKVKAPTMLQIGAKDLRVPPHQGLEYYTRLKANGIKVSMNLYEDNHPLGQVPNEMDNLINSILWFMDHK